MDDLVEIREEGTTGSVLELRAELTHHILVFGYINLILIAFHRHRQLPLYRKRIRPNLPYTLSQLLHLLRSL